MPGCYYLNLQTTNIVSPQNTHDTYRCAAHKLNEIGENNFFCCCFLKVVIFFINSHLLKVLLQSEILWLASAQYEINNLVKHNQSGSLTYSSFAVNTLLDCLMPSNRKHSPVSIPQANEFYYIVYWLLTHKIYIFTIPHQ